MKITYTEVNGRKYAYTCTSQYVPGKNPISKRTYLGVVDPKTNRIIPKKGIYLDDLIFSSEFNVKSYGDVAIVLSAAVSCGLVEDLKSIFGEHSRDILALVIAQAIYPSTPDRLIRTLYESYICESLGIEIKSFDPNTVLRTINSISNSDVETFFQTRRTRSGHRFMVIPISMSLTEGMNDPLRSIHGVHCNDDIILSVLIDEKISPVSFMVMRNPANNISNVITMMTRMKDAGIHCTYISDPSTSPTLRLSQFVDNELDFIVPYPISSTQFQMILDDSNDLFDSENYMLADGSRVKEIEVGLVLDNRNGYCVGMSDARFKDCRTRLQAFISFDPKINVGAKNAVNNIIRNVKAELNDMPSDNPEQDLLTAAGSLVDLMKISMNRDGLMKVSVRRDRMELFKQNAGKSLVITSGSSWDEVVRVRSSRNTLLKIVNQYYGGSKWLLRHVDRNVNITSQLFIEYLVMIIYSDIRRTLDDHGIDTSIRDSLQLTSSLKVVITSVGNTLSTVDRGTKKLFAAFGVSPDAIHNSK